ncbi:MAG: Na+/H+ antiporter NhaC family protein, partial [Candidatus Methanomethylophilaceae archaeon]|nr:Na+/H+ antiporter NhaC family protein [Candidatus Methanomethylophilaceae archaeon]
SNRFYTTVWALIPPLIAITLALITKEVFSSLFVGILIGAVLWADFDGVLTINHVVDDGFVGVLADSWDAGILVFLVILGIIGVLVLKSGGTKAYGEWALKHIKSRRMAQLSTFFLGVLIFVDDYFNCLTVGSIMRPLTDKFKISRAKLAYLIDSTAAPICIIAPVSSWAAAVTSNLGEDVYGHNTMEIFVECIPYNLYAILTIVMVVTICLLGFDFGPMKKHEDNAMNNGDLFSTTDRPYENVVEEKVNENGHILDLVLPIFLFLIPACIVSLVYTGGLFDGKDFVQAFADADAARGLAMGSIIGLILTIIYLVLRKASTFHDLMDALPKGFRNMVPAILILIFAWSLTTMTKALGSSAFVADALADSGSLENFLPAIFMLVACFIAFSTGTSWGTMGILLPIVVSVFPDNYSLLIIAISACMAGAVFGDHCSPISDTTIMSSAGAQCSHVVHVSTQVPYALVVAGTCFVFYIIAGFIQSWIVTIVACAAMVGVIFLLRQITIAMENKKSAAA